MHDPDRPPLDYATPGTPRPTTPRRWYQLDYSHEDLILVLLFLAVLVMLVRAL